jgi:hypothetical protein
MASLFNVIFSISQRISQYQLTMQFLGAFSLLSFLAGLAVAAYNDACPSCTEIYDGGCDKDSGTVKILIGNGGAGPSKWTCERYISPNRSTPHNKCDINQRAQRLLTVLSKSKQITAATISSR